MVKVSKEVSEQNDRSLADSADLLSRRHGLDRVSIAQIAKRAKLTTGAVYTRFGSREALMAAGLQAGFDRMCAWLETLNSREEYLSHARSKGRSSDGTLWCPAMSHVGTIRTASQLERTVFADGVDRMLIRMMEWHDIDSRAHAEETLAALTGHVLFEFPTIDDHSAQESHGEGPGPADCSEEP